MLIYDDDTSRTMTRFLHIHMWRHIQTRYLQYLTNSKVKVKVKCTLVQALKLCTGCTAHRGSRGKAPLFLEGLASRPGRSLPRERLGTHCTGGWVGSQGRSGKLRKISPPPGFDPRTIQPVAQSLYRLSYRAHWPTAGDLKITEMY